MSTDQCSLALRDCEADADYRLVLTPPDEEFEPMERMVCHSHLHWYRQTFVDERDYEMEVIPVSEYGARQRGQS